MYNLTIRLRFVHMLVFLGLSWKLCETASPKIKLLKDGSCHSTAEFEWIIFEMQDALSNCSILYSSTENFSLGNVNEFADYPAMKNGGSFKISGLVVGLNYSVQIKCSAASSDVLTFVVEDEDCPSPNDSTESPVVVFKDQSSFLGTRDSILGIVFGLFGLTIILVATFYIVRKVRRRQRLERIRRYLGSSLIDPFENIQDTERGSGSERLIEATDS